MAQRQASIERQIREAERDKLLAEIGKVKAETNQIDFECNESSKSWIKKKEFWSILVGTLIAWTAVGFYITFSVIPLSEIHNNEVTLENNKKSAALFESERQLHLAYDTLKIKNTNLNIVTLKVAQQKEEVLKLKIARKKLDSSYSVVYQLYSNKRQINANEIQKEIIKFKEYLDDYKQKQSIVTTSTQILPYDLNQFSKANWNTNLAAKSQNLSGIEDLYHFSSVSIRDSLPEIGINSIFAKTVTIRPLFNGELVKDLTIHVSMKPPSGFLSFQTSRLLTSAFDILYNKTGYVTSESLIGECTFEVNGEDYKVSDIKIAGHYFLTNSNHVTINFPDNINKLNIDLLLEKK